MGEVSKLTTNENHQSMLSQIVNLEILTPAVQEVMNIVWSLYCKYKILPLQNARFIKALLKVIELHRLRLRKSGESYLIHDLRCAAMALAANLPIEMAIIMLIHEFIEDDGWTYEQVIEEFGEEIAEVVLALSKPPKVFLTRLDRIMSHLEILKKASSNWKVPMGKSIDREENTHDTAGLGETDQKQLYSETESLFLPWFEDSQKFIPKKYKNVYAMITIRIKNACINYKQRMVCAGQEC